MNARLAIEENKLEVKWAIETAERVMKVRNITKLEALEYGRAVKMKYASNDTERAAIEIRYDEAKRIVENK